MRRQLLLLVLAFTTSCQDGWDMVGPRVEPSARDLSSAQARDGTENQYIVVFNRTVPNPRGLAQTLVREHGGSLRFTYEHALKGFSATLPPQAVVALRNNPNVAYIEPNRIVTGDGSQSNPPWGLDRIDQRGLPLDQTYNYDWAGAGVNLYLLDSGIRFDHQDFGGRALFGTDVFTGDANTGGADCNGHGTHSAGIAGGVTHGVAKAAKLYAVRVLNCSNSGTLDGVAAGVDWVTGNHVKPAVANMSLSSSTASTAVDEAVQASIAAGVTYVVSAGTSATQPGDACTRSPARVPEAITVGATNQDDSMGAYSFFGPCVDWFAPGTGILSASHESTTATLTRTGTSQAAPHAAGVAALFLETNPAATPQQVYEALRAELALNVVTDTGAGTVNNHLLYSRGNWAPSPPNQAPSAAIASPVDASVAHQGEAVSFQGSGSDPEDGMLTGSSLVWTSNLNGLIGTGTSFSRSDLSVGPHTITLTATDSHGASGQATVQLIINQPPTASFSVNCRNSASCKFTNGSTDADGTVTAWSWSFGPQGATSTVRNPSYTYTTAGTYIVTLTVVDNRGATSSPATRSIECKLDKKKLRCS